MTFKRALELDAHVCKGDHGSLVVFADTMTRTEKNDGEDVEREIPFLNCEQIEGLPQHYYARPENPLAASKFTHSSVRCVR